ncbi:MAG: hypothetical protein SFY56_14890 [Bacteroidota bacterium]|nr:hypothetical protein [Bacteroidota bacterium]
MAFTGNEAEEFPLETAAEWTRNYRETMKEGEPKAHFFGRNIINRILEQPGCMGIRIYYALDDQGKKQLIMVGADENENDLFNGIIAEKSFWCPPFCDGSGSPLNS